MLFLVGASFTLVAYASPLSASGSAPRTVDAGQDSTGDSNCGFTGNADMYGLGIRIGVYCQALAGAVASGFYQDSADGIQWANGYFRWALFIALCYLTSTNQEFQVVEAAIIVLLGLISVLYNFDNHWDYNQTFIKKLIPLAVYQLTATGLFLYSIW
jgi:hypothetical protein